MSIETVRARIQSISEFTPPMSSAAQDAMVTPAFQAAMNQLSAQGQMVAGTAPPADVTTAPSGTPGSVDVATTGASGLASENGNSVADWSSLVTAASTKYGVDAALISAVMQQESGGHPNATSAAGAQGLMQLMPATSASYGVTNPYDPAQSIDAGTRYLKSLLDRFNGDPALAAAGYNAGPNAVAKYGGIPPYAETQNYVQKVLAKMNAIAASGRLP